MDENYQTPGPELARLVDAPRPPAFYLGPRRDFALLVDRPGLPGIAEVAQPELKLAGLRINARMRAASRVEFGRDLSILDIATADCREVTGLPPTPRIADLAWSPDGRRVAFSRWGDDGVELWLLDIANAQACRLTAAPLLTVVDRGFAWLGNDSLLAMLPAADAGPEPKRPPAPRGPAVQESLGGAVSQTTTYADMLRTPFDEDLLEWHLRGQPASIGLDGTVTRFGSTGTWLGTEASPDARFILTVEVHRPFSYLVPIGRFPSRVPVFDRQGRLVHQVADLPLVERLPPGNDAVPPGPRGIRWRADAPASLAWAEARDGGDPAAGASISDALVEHAAPFDAPPRDLAAFAWRLVDVAWGHDELALVTEGWWKTRDTRTWRIRPGTRPGTPAAAPELLFARKSEDRYADPGDPSMRPTASGRRVLNLSPDGHAIYLIGAGASPEGDRPFVDRFDLRTREKTRLWRSAAPFYEEPVALLDDRAQAMLSRRESNDTPPNFLRRSLDGQGEPLALTRFPDPTPELRAVRKELLAYQRADGVALTATLYLPPGYDPARDGPRPALFWAYPREFKSGAAASQVRDSPYRFNQVSFWGPLALLARGYVVVDNPAMPIVGQGDQEPNDTYLEQLQASAQAAVDAVVARGVADPARLAVGGHSYGAFMTANLLAHTTLFRAGIARSGAYNRTLTPFGFQNEERNYWRGRDAYLQMSPFNFADRIKAPLLLIHGAVDNNSGTYPLQSERMYQALQGLGGNVRWVVLPEESHHYLARESLLHMLWEEDQWLGRWLGPA